MNQSDLLLKEAVEHNNHLRTLFQLFTAWYTFFVPANLFSVSILFDKSKNLGAHRTDLAVVHALVNALGVVAAFLLARHTATTDRRVGQLMAELAAATRLHNPSCSPDALVALSAVPSRFVRLALYLMALSLFAIFGFWLRVLILAA